MALFGKQDNATSRPKFLERGQVLKVNVTAGGTGYTDGAAATFDAAPGGGVTATGTINVSGGVITSITITNPGAGYTTAPGVTVGGGTSATFATKIAPNRYTNGNIVFVDRTEAQTESNKSKGITSPGWWVVKEWSDNAGNKRYQAEHIIAMSNTVTAGTAGDAADDAIAADVNTVIAISVQPANQTTVTGGATFGVTAAFSAGSGTLAYQWQKATVGTTRFVNVGGATSATLALTGQTSGATGDRYRVVVSDTTGGAKAVTSTAATLTFGT